jgi:hypothetical protein
MHHQSTQQGPPKNYTRKQGPGEKTASGQSLPDDTVFVPPISMFLLGGGGILVALGANVWQVFTSFSAFFTMFTQGDNYQAMKPLDRIGAQPLISIVCLFINWEYASHYQSLSLLLQPTGATTAVYDRGGVLHFVPVMQVDRRLLWVNPILASGFTIFSFAKRG